MNDPVVRFQELLSQAERIGIQLHNAAALATAGNDGLPTVRMVLVKDVDEKDFVFYTNLESLKARQLRRTPARRFASGGRSCDTRCGLKAGSSSSMTARPTSISPAGRAGSQIGAWASQQSSELSSRDELIAAVASLTDKYRDQAVPRPAFWSGYRLVPDCIEFWKEQPDRLHEREVYTRETGGWKITLLAP